MHGSEDDAGDEYDRVTFGKFVSSFNYCCRNSSKFREEAVCRKRHIDALRQLLRRTVQDVVSQVCAASATDRLCGQQQWDSFQSRQDDLQVSDQYNHSRISDAEADEYILEWSNTERVRAYRNGSGGHPFR